MAGKRYPSDLTDAQGQRLEPRIPPAKPGGSPRRVDMRAVLNGIIYVTREGVSWRAFPHDYPHASVCSWYVRRFQADATWEEINDTLRKDLRVAAGRDSAPSVARIASPSVKTTEKGGGTQATRRANR